MLFENTTPVNYSDEKLKMKMAELQAKLSMKADADDYEIRGLEYKEGDTKSVYVRVYHKVCDTEFHTTASRFFNNVNAKCPECTVNEKRITIEQVRKIVEDDTNNEYTLLSTSIKNAKDSIKVKHNTCGKEYDITLRKFREGSRCSCTKKAQTTSVTLSKPISSEEAKKNRKEQLKEIYKYIRSLYKGEIVTGKEVPGTNVKVSIYIPEFHTAIQYIDLIADSEEGSGGIHNRKYNIDRLRELDNVEERIIHIMSDEWLHKQDIVKSKIQHILKLGNKKRIYARKCTVKEVDSRTRCAFLEENHIQGKDSANVSLGLYYKDPDKDNEEILVSVMSYIKPRKALNGNSKYDYELSRFASLKDYNVVGGFSKLLKYFKDNYEWSLVVTYADMRYTSLHSSVYLANGFTHIHESDPSYSYINTSLSDPSREFRFKYRKQELNKFFPSIYDDSKTEKQIMQEAGFVRVWDCGNVVFELENK